MTYKDFISLVFPQCLYYKSCRPVKVLQKIGIGLINYGYVQHSIAFNYRWNGRLEIHDTYNMCDPVHGELLSITCSKIIGKVEPGGDPTREATEARVTGSGG